MAICIYTRTTCNRKEVSYELRLGSLAVPRSRSVPYPPVLCVRLFLPQVWPGMTQFHPNSYLGPRDDRHHVPQTLTPGSRSRSIEHWIHPKQRATSSRMTSVKRLPEWPTINIYYLNKHNPNQSQLNPNFSSRNGLQYKAKRWMFVSNQLPKAVSRRWSVDELRCASLRFIDFCREVNLNRTCQKNISNMSNLIRHLISVYFNSIYFNIF